MKYSQMKRFLMEHKDSMKPPYISTLDGILTAGGEIDRIPGTGNGQPLSGCA